MFDEAAEGVSAGTAATCRQQGPGQTIQGGDRQASEDMGPEPEIVLYLAPYVDDQALKKKLGKHKAGTGCRCVKKLADIDLGVLRKLAQASVTALNERYPEN
jgi:hypothetical protein